jgi:hypothetical protein
MSQAMHDRPANAGGFPAESPPAPLKFASDIRRGTRRGLKRNKGKAPFGARSLRAFAVAKGA